MARVDHVPSRVEQIEQEAGVSAAQRLLLAKGAAEWDARRFFDAHETWEELWMDEPRPIRSFFQGLILLAAGLHHWTGTHKPRGVQTKLATGIERLAPYAPVFLGVDVTSMIVDAGALLRESAGLDAARLAATSGEMFPKFRWRGTSQSPHAYVLALVSLNDLTDDPHHQIGMFDHMALAHTGSDLFAGMPAERDWLQLPLAGGLTVAPGPAGDASPTAPDSDDSPLAGPTFEKSTEIVRIGLQQTTLWHQQPDSATGHHSPPLVAYGSLNVAMQLGLWHATMPDLIVRRIRDTARLPERATTLSSGLDLYADLAPENELRIDSSSGVVQVPTGISISLPPSYEGQVRPRSGLWRQGVEVGFGTIDADYRGELLVQMTLRAGAGSYTIHHADRVAQLVIAQVALPAIHEVDELGETERGAGGFGSTGR